MNSTTLLPDPDLEPPVQDCQQVLAKAHGWHKDLTDEPLEGADITWFTDGSSYQEEGKRHAGAAVVDRHQVIWAQALPEGTSAQKAELVALTKALELRKGKKKKTTTSTLTAGMLLPQFTSMRTCINRRVY